MWGEGGRQTRSNELHGSPMCPSTTVIKLETRNFRRSIRNILLTRKMIHGHQKVKEVMFKGEGWRSSSEKKDEEEEKGKHSTIFLFSLRIVSSVQSTLIRKLPSPPLSHHFTLLSSITPCISFPLSDRALFSSFSVEGLHKSWQQFSCIFSQIAPFEYTDSSLKQLQNLYYFKNSLVFINKLLLNL